MTQKGWQDLARLSAWVGGCTLEAANTTIERLSSLVDHNLLLRSVGAQGSRCSMLEPIRELASEELEGSGEANELRRCHAEHALARRIARSLGR